MPAAPSTHDLEVLTESLGALVRRLDPGELPATDGVRLVELGTQLGRLGHAVRLAGAAMVTEAGTWQGEGDKTAAVWLARRCGTSMSDAIGTVQTAEALAALPATAAAVRQGQLSPEQTREIAGAAAADPTAEQRLIDQAQRASVNELRDACRRTRAAVDPDPEATHRRIHRNRHVRVRTDADGTWTLTARGTGAAGARILAGLHHHADRLFRQAHRQGRREPAEAYVFDALEELCAHGGAGVDGATPLPKGANAKILARIDWPALVRGHTHHGETCEIVGIGPVPVSVVRELSTDAFVAAILTHGTDIRSVTHLGRRHTALQNTALQWQDPECARLGCNKTIRLENDHRADWAATHETTVEHSDRLCHDDHQLKTRHGWMLTDGTGKRPMVPPDHPDHPLQTALQPFARARPDPPP